ncbi:MAG: universal stress protein [Syntrophomonadaceae bacterium]|jgi:nucleotide-binding universal stress UspA family protein|nr:universal stress protein [Syntrophomonadaceae bacterium]
MEALFNKALVPVDDSEQALRAVHKAAQLVSAGVIKSLVLLNVYDSSNVDITKLHSQDKLDDLRADSLELLQRYESIMLEKDVHPRLKRAGGEPSALILDVVDNDGSYDLIIMGSRKLNKFKELTLGSVSDRVGRLVDIPVLIIK